MVTKNWYAFFRSNTFKKVIEKSAVSLSGIEINSGYMTAFPEHMFFRHTSATFSNTNGICLGSGTTPATVNDYNLESRITSGLSASVAQSNDENNDPVYIIAITNTSNEAITIAEVGMIGQLYQGTNNSSTMVLYERTVLDTPITIEAGGIGQVTYTIRMNYPTA